MSITNAEPRDEVAVRPVRPDASPSQSTEDRRPPGARRVRVDHRRARRIALAALLIVITVLGLHKIAGTYHYDQAQEHLTDEFLEPSPSVGGGEALGVIQAPSIDLNDVFVEGIADSDLRRGPGHHPRSALPGTDGVAVVVGRRSQFGGPFADVSSLAVGDQVVVQLRGGATSAYTITEVASVAARDLDSRVNGATPGTLVLVTSGGGIFGGDRVVVFATLEGSGEPSQGTDSIAFADVQGTEIVVWLLWAGAAVVITVVGRRVLRVRGARPGIVLVVPLAGFVALQLWLATSALLPMTY